jgi:hypothetical protein
MLDAERGRSYGDGIIGHAVVEAKLSVSAVPKTVDLTGALQIEVIQVVVSLVLVSAKNDVTG